MDVETKRMEDNGKPFKVKIKDDVVHSCQDCNETFSEEDFDEHDCKGVETNLT